MNLNKYSVTFLLCINLKITARHNFMMQIECECLIYFLSGEYKLESQLIKAKS